MLKVLTFSLMAALTAGCATTNPKPLVLDPMEQMQGRVSDMQRQLETLQQQNVKLQDRVDNGEQILTIGVGALGVLLGTQLPGMLGATAPPKPQAPTQSDIYSKPTSHNL